MEQFCKGEDIIMTEKKKLVACGLTGRRGLDILYLEKALTEYGDDLNIVSWINHILRALRWNS